MSWKVKNVKKTSKPKKMVLVEGLPGIGNVGKVAADFIVDAIKAEKIINFESYSLPHYVFVNENNLVELPSINIYKKNLKDLTLFIVAGDTQPLDEKSCYDFCNSLLDLCKQNNCEEIITLGGVGLQDIPKKPKVYVTGNDEMVIGKYNSKGIVNKMYGTVGPIVGVSGLLVGLAKQKNIPAVTLLAETYNHPSYLGIDGAREILKILDKKFKLALDLKEFNKEKIRMEKEIKKFFPAFLKRKEHKKIELGDIGIKEKEDPVDYIG